MSFNPFKRKLAITPGGAQSLKKTPPSSSGEEVKVPVPNATFVEQADTPAGDAPQQDVSTPQLEAREPALEVASTSSTPATPKLSVRFKKAAATPHADEPQDTPSAKAEPDRAKGAHWVSTLFSRKSKRKTLESTSQTEVPIVAAVASSVAEVAVAQDGKVAEDVSPSKPGKAAKEAKPVKAKAPKEPKAPKASAGEGTGTKLLDRLKLSSLIRPEVLTVLTEANSIGSLGWKVGQSSMEEIELSAASTFLSFSHHDKRYSVESDMKSSEAQNLVLSENGESYYINRAAQGEALYATSVARLGRLARPICPALLVLEQALKDKIATQGRYIIGVSLVDEKTGMDLTVYYYQGPNREFSEPEIVINPSNLTFLLSSFALKNRTSLNECQVYLLNNAELIQAVHKYWHGYPQEPEIHGFSIRKLVMAASLLGMAGAGATVIYAGQAYYSKSSHQAQEAEWKQQSSDFNNKTNEFLMARVVSFAKTQQVLLQSSFEDAHKLWQPGLKVMMALTPERRIYELSLPLVKGQLTTDKEQVTQLLGITPPDGCMQDNILLTGALNDLKLKIQCEVPAGPLSGYRVN